MMTIEGYDQTIRQRLIMESIFLMERNLDAGYKDVKILNKLVSGKKNLFQKLYIVIMLR